MFTNIILKVQPCPKSVSSKTVNVPSRIFKQLISSCYIVISLQIKYIIIIIIIIIIISGVYIMLYLMKPTPHVLDVYQYVI